jgi:hypothetical protein
MELVVVNGASNISKRVI